MRIARVSSVVVVLALGAFGLARPDDVLLGGLAWLVFLMFVLSGLGAVVAWLGRADEPEFGLRAVWGAAGYLAIAGVLVAFDLCTRPVILALIGIGAAAFAWREWTTPRPVAQMARDGLAWVRERPVIAYFAVVVAAAAILHVVGAVARLDRNPWDDDIAYTPFTKRLLDAGDMIEPFSFRRLASYGGQIALEALAGSRGSLANVHLIDQGLCFALVLLLAIGYARELGRASGLWLGLVGLVLVMLPDLSINTASYWSGAAMIFGMYRTVVRGRYDLAAVVGAATCTLRPTCIPVVVLFLVFALGFRLRAAALEHGWRDAWRKERATWLLTGLAGLAVLIPWCLASQRACGTFLFPFVQGTWNHGLSLAPSGWTWLDDLSLVLRTCIDSQPLVISVFVVPLLAFTTDRRPARPLVALLLASVPAFVLLVHSFPDADSGTLWRYAFGYVITLFVVFVLEVGSTDRDDADPAAHPIHLPALGRWVLLGAILVQLAASRTGLIKDYAAKLHDVREAFVIANHGDPNARAERRRYVAMQAAIPEGASVLVLLDDPAFFDFRRNWIVNIDTPGFASPGTQLPAFTTPEALRDYLLEEGLRYVAFVRPERSRYFFRREFWVWRVFNDIEFFQAMSAYMIDTIDSLQALAMSQAVLYDRDGLVVLDLGTGHHQPPVLDPGDEPLRREAFVRALATREHFEREWSLSTRHDFVFEDGQSGLTFAQADADARWYDFVVRDREPTQGTPVRWLGSRPHFRIQAQRAMHLAMHGKVNTDLVYTHPRIDVALDGELIASVEVAADGRFSIDVDVPPLSGWADLYLVFDTIGDPVTDVRDLRLARLEEVTWQPR